jgi:repressor LexA
VSLTSKQQRLLRFIGTFVDEHGYPPTLSEIGLHFGSPYPSSCFDTIAALVRKGLLTKRPLIARGIALTEKGREHLRYLKTEAEDRRQLG